MDNEEFNALALKHCDSWDEDEELVFSFSGGNLRDFAIAHALAERAASNPASPAPVAAITDEKLWALIDAYADMRAEYQFSTARHLAKQQRENVEDAKADLRAALSSAPMAQAEPGESLSKIVLEAVYRACQRGGSPEQLHAAIMSGIAATPAVPAAPSERDAEWKENTGTQPTANSDLVDVQFRNGDSTLGMRADDWIWDHNSNDVEPEWEIVRWRLAAPAAPIERENGHA